MVAWTYLVVAHLLGHGSTADEAWRFAPGDWVMMVVAMMVPAMLPAIRLVGLDSLWNRRVRAPGIFVATNVLVWTAVAAGTAVVIVTAEAATGASFVPDRRWITVALVAAAAWQFTPAKLRFLRRCHLRTPLAPRGWRADRAVIRYGLVHGRACVGSCLFLMAAMFLAGQDHVHLMLPATLVTVVERRRPRPDPRPGGWALLALAAFWPLT